MNISHQWRRRWGSTGPPLGFKVSIARQNFGQFLIFWAILHQKFGRFYIFWAISYVWGNFAAHQFHPFFLFLESNRKVGNEWNRNKQMTFFLNQLKLDKKTIDFTGKIQCIKSFFRQKFGAPPNHFELLRPCFSFSFF